jgi:chemotaxis protein MotB
VKFSGSGAASQKSKNRGGADKRAAQGDHSRIHTLRPGEHAVIGGVVYFAEGSSDLSKEQEKQLEIIAEELQGKPQKVEIRGHTSRRPLSGSAPFRDNWDLAYSRCRHTMEYLVSLGLDSKRFRLSVAAENEPAPGGADALERGLNSRVEVSLLNEVVADGDAKSASQTSGSKDVQTKNSTDDPASQSSE